MVTGRLRTLLGRRRIAGLLCGIACVTAITACGSSAIHKATNTTKAKDSTLTLIESGPPSTLNPALALGGFLQYAQIAYGSLFHMVSYGHYTPELAKSFTWIGSGHMKFKIEFRNDVKFSDGTKLTSYVEKYFIKYVISNIGDAGTNNFPIKSMSTPDATTLVVTLSRPTPDAEESFATSDGGYGAPISEQALKDHSKQLGYQTYGAGAYKLDPKATTSGSVYTYVRNPDYYDPARQKFAKIAVKVISDTESAIEDAATSAYAVTYGSEQDNKAAESQGLALVPSAYTDSYELNILDRVGKLVPALGSVKVREALNYAVNRAAAAAIVGAEPSEEFIPRTVSGYYKDSIYSYDPTKAKRLLAEAGFSHGFTFSTVVEAASPQAQDLAELLVSEFHKVGVTMKLVSEPTSAAFETAEHTGKYPAYILSGYWCDSPTACLWTLLPQSDSDPISKSAVPSKTFVSDYWKAASYSGVKAENAWEALNRTASLYAPGVNIGWGKLVFYETTNLDVPESWGLPADPTYIAPK